MIKNNNLLETLHKCVKQNTTKGACTGCFYGQSSDDQPSCMLSLMNDVLFFFSNPVPDPNAYILSLEELEEVLADRKDHLAFAEFISNIHVAKPVIRIVKSSGNFITLYDPQTSESDSFNKLEYYSSFRVWSSKPTDTIRNSTPWENLDYSETDNSSINQSKTASIINYVRKMT